MRDFVEHHWGDLVGIFVLCGGATIVLCAPLYHEPIAVANVNGLGGGLVTASLVALKLRGAPKNGNGKEPPKP